MTRESRTVGWQQCALVGILLQMLCMSTGAYAQFCPDDVNSTLTHEYILKGASLAELSYNAPGVHNSTIVYRCPSGHSRTYEVFEQSVVLHDIDLRIFSHARNCVEGTYDEEGADSCVNIGAENNGRNVTRTVLQRRIGSRRFREVHYRCTDGNSNLNNLTLTLQWADTQDGLSLLTRLGILGIEAIEYTEDLRLVQSSSGEWDEETLAIRGTNPFGSQSFLTTVHALRGQSCLFDLALEITASFFGEECRSLTSPDNFRGLIVGHSLGGMAAEYIAMNGGIQFVMERCDASDDSIRVLSYNSIGWDPNDSLLASNDNNQSRIYSTRINGEILEQLFPNRVYLGDVVRYDYLEDNCNPLCLHGINTVQRAIRRCQSCEGMEFSYREPIALQ